MGYLTYTKHALLFENPSSQWLTKFLISRFDVLFTTLLIVARYCTVYITVIYEIFLTKALWTPDVKNSSEKKSREPETTTRALLRAWRAAINTVLFPTACGYYDNKIIKCKLNMILIMFDNVQTNIYIIYILLHQQEHLACKSRQY